MTTHTTRSNQPLKQTDDDDNDKINSAPPPPNSKLAVEPEETRHVTISEAIGLDFNSCIPQADITSQVHFISNIQADSEPSLAGLKNGDRILQINGINITSFEHEDVRKLMQLMTPIVLTVANDPKYLVLLQEPIHDIEEKQPERPIISGDDDDSDPNQRRIFRFELKRQPSFEPMTSSISTASKSTKSSRYEIFNLTQPDESSTEEPLKAKICHLRKTGLRENDVILFVGKTKIEKLTHEDIKVMIRAAALASNQVDLTVISKLDIPEYKTLQEKGLTDWSIMGLER
ncbi:unnamed protein product [Adineta steineri]|uniref:PDZ domain-containing protein n=1 Tax=Adineta steineri TaxID=433720 RepID=A0A816AZH3_9BILA|nr:unnamed protein product [Adineta steineri]CAF1603722.1 unnamed protein product [Adineta steineri]